MVDQFKLLEGASRIENTFFFLCLDNRPELVDYESFLSDFGVLSWNRSKLDHLKNRASENNREQSISSLMEGLVARYYSSKMGVPTVEPSPAVENDRFADLKIALKERPVFLEMTSLGTRLFEEKLEEVYGQACDRILPKLKRNRIVNFVVDATRLPLDCNGHLDVQKSVECLDSWVKNLELTELIDSSISPAFSLNLDDVSRLPNKEKTVYDHSKWEVGPYNMLQLSDYHLWGLIGVGPMQKWAQRITPKMVTGCPIVYFVAGDARKYPMVQFGSELAFPSKAAQLETKAFLDHLGRVVTEKLKQGQRETNSPNILVVRASNWLTQGYDTSDDLAVLGFDRIERTIRECLEAYSVPELSAVKIYDWDYSKARTVLNPNVNAELSLIPEELAQLS